MFEFMGGIFDSVFLFGFGAVVYLKAPSFIRKEGTPSEIEKRIRLMKRCAAILIGLGVGSLLIKLVA